jgi:hypothetical protein
MAGYAMYIYHLRPDEANRVRRELGLKGLKGKRKAECDGVVPHE